MSKDAGFKVVSHMMPNLPNVPLERDIEQFVVGGGGEMEWRGGGGDGLKEGDRVEGGRDGVEGGG